MKEITIENPKKLILLLLFKEFTEDTEIG